MGTNSGDGYYQDVDEARDNYGVDDDERERRIADFEKGVHAMQRRFYEAKRAVIGSTIACACCGKLIIKTTYHKKFCTNQKNKKGKRNSCKDRYWNLVNPRGKFEHLGY